MPNLPNEKLLKVILIGEPGVGKTSLRKRYLGEGFKSTYMATIGADFSFLKTKNQKVSLWDIAGERNYHQIRSQYYIGTDAVIFVFDITRHDTLKRFKIWKAEVESTVNKSVPIVFVGNKEDLRDTAEDAIDKGTVETKIEKWRKLMEQEMPLVYSSAKTGLNVDRLFSFILDELIQGENRSSLKGDMTN